MKILTVVGTRPELIRLSLIIKKLDSLVDHILVYTNQNYDYNLSGIFFNELKIREPNYFFNKESKSFSQFASNTFELFNSILESEKPDKILVLGDTNSGLLSIVAKKANIPVVHMEAGNRSYDDRLPEETNRRIIDSVSKYNLPYTENSKQNLLNEGFHKNFVFKTGNPIFEVLLHYNDEIEGSNILTSLNVERQRYVLVTAHRSENVDNVVSLTGICSAINKIAEQFKVIFPVHPRTKEKLGKFNITLSDNVVVADPMGFFDFVKLEKNALVVISDSGTVQEETCIYGVPSLTIRETTERQETIECGSNILVGTDTDDILGAYNTVIDRDYAWMPPDDYLVRNVSDVVINILLGK